MGRIFATMDEPDLAGELVHFVSAVTFTHTANALGSLPAEMLAALDINSGEHIAAIVVGTFLGHLPSAADVDGGVDLTFTNLSRGTYPDVGCDDFVRSACFEVKSMRGDFRRFFNQRSTKIGDTHETTIKTLDDVVGAAQREIRLAADALRAKTDETQSRNIVVLVHSFEHIAIETIEALFVSHLLDPPGDDLADVATIWLVLYPFHAVRWERARQRWVNLGSGGSLVGNSDRPDSFADVLMASEKLFCDVHRDGRQSAWAVFHEDGAVGWRQGDVGEAELSDER